MRAFRRSLRRVFDSVSSKMGFLIIPTRKLNKYLLANRLNRIFSEYHIDCVLDVGANRGQYHDFLRRQVGYDGLIISFEPDPDCFSTLVERQKKDHKWIVINYALAMEENELEFNIMKKSVFNSFLEPDSKQTQLFSESNLIEKTIKVTTKRLDEVIDNLKDIHQFNNMFLKLDTQGFDLEVFEGASGCIELIRGVQSEVSFIPIYKKMPTFEMSIQSFRSKGFEISALYSLSESRFPHAVEFDCIYLPK